MKKYLFIFSLLFAINKLMPAQNLPQQYVELTKKADSLFQLKAYESAAHAFSSAFKTLGGKGLLKDRYDAARSWSLAGYTDSAFLNLQKIATAALYFFKYNEISTDTAFAPLHKDKRWQLLLDKIKTKQLKGNLNPKLSLKEELALILLEDQKYRSQLDTLTPESSEWTNNMKLMREKDHFNTIKVKKILDQYGWPSMDNIGENGSKALFLVIQHSDKKTQEKYLPMIREAVKKGNANSASLALLEDRVALNQGKRQIYGSQIGYDNTTGNYYVSPLVKPEEVNKRRKQVGLNPLEEYISQWDITWDVEKHKARIAQIEK